MNKIQVQELLEKFGEGRATEQELRLLEHWFSKQTKLNHDDRMLENSAEVSQQMWMEVYHATAPVSKPNRVKLWPRIAVAASVVFVLGISGYLFFKNQETKVTPLTTFATDVAPGTSGATLTLANGKKIKLQNAAKGQLANEAGVLINKTAEGKLVYELKSSGAEAEDINTLTTAKGETFEVRLPDGSLVWLNAESSISYAATLNNKGLRQVKLDGEAYFEVAHNAERPFRVSSKGQLIEVLGTKFNINAYADEPATTTTLLQGAVKVSKQGAPGKDGIRLQPGQQSTLTKNGLNLSNVNPENAIAWKKGYFDFKAENMESVMRKLSRWYNIEVEYQGDLSNVLIEGEIPRNTSLSQVLQVLKAANINFTITGRKLIVSP
ncbi:transmembrane sensor [Pedobacter africanus]|uniref:Ferric-dicitrate binding protein FerR (Iron transport regulator) n=1 Tax=Pedobacter africanus TaxID=151894 RepID=A0ACC6L3P3_9SPHI|nr:FecR domain-containing protein [Pedobacter africanus]MDR6786116.1 ferric-dicitrate binding protein FerR (iron transport regulator) [Pedobacter africanus]